MSLVVILKYLIFFKIQNNVILTSYVPHKAGVKLRNVGDTGKHSTEVFLFLKLNRKQSESNFYIYKKNKCYCLALFVVILGSEYITGVYGKKHYNREHIVFKNCT